MNPSTLETAEGVAFPEAPRLKVPREKEARRNRRWEEGVLAGEKRVLAMIAGGHSLLSILDALCLVVQEACHGSLCSILLLDLKGERLWQGAAPSLPKSYFEAFNGRDIASCWGPGGAAAFRQEQVIVSGIPANPFWAGCRDIVISNRLRSSWCVPIFSSEKRVLGRLTILSREQCSPTYEYRSVMTQFTQLASIAIERTRSQEALQASERLARGQVEALTRTLAALAQEPDPDRVLEHVLRTIVEQTHAHSIAAWNRNDDGVRFDMIAVIEDDQYQTRLDAIHPVRRLSMPAEHHPIWRQVLRTGQYGMIDDLDKESARMCIGSGDWHRVVEDVDADPAFTGLMKYLRGAGVCAVLFVPMLMAGNVAGALAIHFQEKRTFRREQIDLTRALAHQAMLALQLMRLSQQRRQAAVMEERNRMALDIHDTLAQGFTGVIVQLEALEEAMSQRLAAKAEDHLARAGELARESLREARRSVRALRPRSLEEKGLCEALKALIRKMTDGTGMRASFTVQGEPWNLPPEWEENLLHIGQEVLTNAVRHAQASRFDMQMVFDDGELQLLLSDNGTGFDPERRHDGFGLQGMRERVGRIGGQLAVQSVKGAGTAVRIVLPLANVSPLKQP